MRTLLIATLLLVATAACAQENDPEKAQEAFEAAKALYDKGDFRGALDKLREAYGHYPDPAIQLSIAKRLLDLDEPEQALAELQAVKAKDKKLKAAVKSEIESVQEILAQPVLVTFETDPPGAMLSIDGAEPMKSPARKSMPRGTVRVVVALSGHETLQENVLIKGTKPFTKAWTLVAMTGNLTIEVLGARPGANPYVTLDGKAAVPGRPQAIKAGEHVVTCSMPNEPVSTLKTTIQAGKNVTLRCALAGPVDKPVPWKKPAGWASVGAGAAAVATGIALFVSYSQDQDTYAEPQYTVEGSSKQWTGGVATGLGAGLIGLGTYWLLTD